MRIREFVGLSYRVIGAIMSNDLFRDLKNYQMEAKISAV